MTDPTRAGPTGERFPLAPMSGFIRALTVAVLAIPAVFLGFGLLRGNVPALALALAVAALCLGVWLWSRPTEFVVSPRGLTLRWPLRALEVSRSEIEGARLMDASAVRAELGLALRIGVGGLFGGFGWLWTRRRGLVDFYISRTDGFVLIERRRGRPLLITPERPGALVAALAVRAGR
jgi:hypothetical protein